MSSRINCISYRNLPILLKMGCIGCLPCLFSVLTELPVLVGIFINEKMGFHLTHFFFLTKQNQNHNTETEEGIPKGLTQFMHVLTFLLSGHPREQIRTTGKWANTFRTGKKGKQKLQMCPEENTQFSAEFCWLSYVYRCQKIWDWHQFAVWTISSGNFNTHSCLGWMVIPVYCMCVLIRVFLLKHFYTILSECANL